MQRQWHLRTERRVRVPDWIRRRELRGLRAELLQLSDVSVLQRGDHVQRQRLVHRRWQLRVQHRFYGTEL